jgi:hypothetical protein
MDFIKKFEIISSLIGFFSILIFMISFAQKIRHVILKYLLSAGLVFIGYLGSKLGLRFLFGTIYGYYPLFIFLLELIFPIKSSEGKRKLSIISILFFSYFILCYYFNIFNLFYTEENLNFQKSLIQKYNVFCLIISFLLTVKLLMLHRDGKRLFAQIAKKQIGEILILSDLIFSLLLLTFSYNNQIEWVRLLLFIYGFRLLRILTLIPYFDKILKSIIKGLRLTGNYIVAFTVILFVFSINSRILFGASHPIFKSLGDSIFTNFKIILGNGFDLVPNFNNQIGLSLYIFFVTLIIGIIFISTITALITDSLLASDKTIEKTEETPWYKRRENEESLDYIERLIYTIAFV